MCLYKKQLTQLLGTASHQCRQPLPSSSCVPHQSPSLPPRALTPLPRLAPSSHCHPTPCPHICSHTFTLTFIVICSHLCSHSLIYAHVLTFIPSYPAHTLTRITCPHTHMLTHMLMHTHTPTHQEQLRTQKWPLPTRRVDKECLKPWPHDVLCPPTCCVTKSLLLSQTQIYRCRACMIVAPDFAFSQVTVATNLRVRDLSREKAVRGDGV